MYHLAQHTSQLKLANNPLPYGDYFCSDELFPPSRKALSWTFKDFTFVLKLSMDPSTIPGTKSVVGYYQNNYYKHVFLKTVRYLRWEKFQFMRSTGYVRRSTLFKLRTE